MAVTTAMTTQVTQLYVALFGRAPDTGGLGFWVQALASGKTMEQVAQSMYATDPARTYFPTWMTNGQIVTSFYVNVLGRQPDAEGLAYWTAKMNAPGATPGSVIVQMIDNVANYTGTNADGLASQALFNNKVAVAEYWGTHVGTVEGSEFVLDPVTSAPGSVTSTIAEIDAGHITGVKVTPSTASANEGTTVHFTLNTDLVQPGATYNYTITGVSAADVAGGVLAGTVTIDANGQAGIDVTLVNDATTEGAETLVLNVAGQASQVTVNDTSKAPTLYTLTTGVDTIDGSSGDDTFKATAATLQLGDDLDGLGGNDRLEVSISGGAITLDGFASTSIETVSVKSLATAASTLDLSDTQGVTTLESVETDGAALTFRDIQSVNDTNIRVIDTDETHNFTYDANAYGPGTDTVEIELQEVRGAEINFGDVGEGLGSSEVDQIDITSSQRAAGQPTPATANVVSDLNVGDALQTVMIDGNAHLTVEDTLDENIRLVNAGALAANLTLDMSDSNDGIGGVDEVTYIGAQGDDHIEFGDTSNDKDVTLGTGNDWVRTGTGEASVDGGAGNDTIITGALNDLVIAGDGDDVVTDAGSTGALGRYVNFGNSFDLGAGNDILTVNGAANNTVNAGTGNDQVSLNGAGNNIVNLGDGHDTLTVVGDGNNTVNAGTGNDSVSIYANGTKNVTLGDGHDSLYVSGNGNVTATGDAGDDSIHIDGDGVHNINLGTGDDDLSIHGAGDINLITTIVGGDGNDDVDVSLNHRLNADLGTGNDSIMLRARDLSVDDTVAGNAGQDTMILTNFEGYTDGIVGGYLGESETQRTTGFEFFDLRDSGITLTLTDNLIESAENNTVTVITEGAWWDGTQTVDMTPVTAPNYWFTLRGGWNQDIVIVDDATINSFSTLRFDHTAIPWWNSTEDTLRIVDSATVTAADLRNVSGLEIIELVDPPASLTWDIELNADVINQTTGTADLVITVDPHVPSGSVINLTIDPDVFGNVDSTVRVLRNANVLVYVNGVLVTEPEFGTELMDFGGGFGLYVQTQLHFTDGGSGDTLIGTSGNDLFTADSLTEVNNADFADGMGGFDTLRLDFAVANPTASLSEQLDDARITGIERIEFNTGNNVRMDGLNWGPWFWGLDVGDLQELATGSGDDELNNMGGNILYELNGGDDYISVLPNNFWWGGPSIDGGLGIDTVETTSNFWWGEDDHTFSIKNVEFVIDHDAGDDDWVTILSGLPGSSQAPGGLVDFWNIENIWGSEDADNVYADSDGGDISLWGNGGDDTLTVGGNTPSYAYVDGGDGNDTIDVLVSDGNNRYADPSATVYGGAGDDTISVEVNAYLGAGWWAGWDNNDASAYVYGGSGNDTIDVAVSASGTGYWWNDTGAASAYAHVHGDSGNDTITVNVDSSLSSGYWWNDSVADADVYGDSGNDDIDVTVHASNAYGWGGADARASADVYGGSGDDHIVVDVSSDDFGGEWWWTSTVDAYANSTAYVYGDSGNDVIDVHVSASATVFDSEPSGADAYAYVDGGSGDDVIDVVVTASAFAYWWWDTESATADVYGGDGDDDIFVDAQTSATITGGAGDDQIDLAVHTTLNEDTLVFGTIDYDVLQQVSLDTQGSDTITGFNFESGGAGDEDLLDFTAFLGAVLLNNGGEPDFADWTGGPSTYDLTVNGSNVVVIEAAAGFTLQSSNISQQENPVAGTLQIGGTTALGAEGRTVVIVATDTNGTLGYDQFDVYFVQDLDQDFGAAWQVDLVGQISSATEIGAITSVDAANFAT